MKKTNREPEPFPDPPAHLSENSKVLWTTLGPEHASTRGRQAIFAGALEVLDRAAECRRVIEQEGLTSVTTSTGARHVHPLVKVELECRRQFASLWTQLGISHDSTMRLP